MSDAMTGSNANNGPDAETRLDVETRPGAIPDRVAKSERPPMVSKPQITPVVSPVSQGRSVARGAHEAVREQLRRIAALADDGQQAQAREASADLLFDFQPLIAANRDLTSLCEDVLLRCGATALRRRFLLAAYGEDSGPAVSPAGPLGGRAHGGRTPGGREPAPPVWRAAASPVAKLLQGKLPQGKLLQGKLLQGKLRPGRAAKLTKQEV
jgi:hypothetical protein